MGRAGTMSNSSSSDGPSAEAFASGLDAGSRSRIGSEGTGAMKREGGAVSRACSLGAGAAGGSALDSVRRGGAAEGGIEGLAGWTRSAGAAVCGGAGRGVNLP